ncbi:unnamed protein product, partial [Staurois parvus]
MERSGYRRTPYLPRPPWSRLVLERELHAHYLRKGLQHLSDSYECLDASRPWLCYWIVHGLMLLDEPIPESVAS